MYSDLLRVEEPHRSVVFLYKETGGTQERAKCIFCLRCKDRRHTEPHGKDTQVGRRQMTGDGGKFRSEPVVGFWRVRQGRVNSLGLACLNHFSGCTL